MIKIELKNINIFFLIKMYIVHEHSKYTSQIDKYWYFDSINDGLIFLRKMVKKYKEFINYELYEEIFEEKYDELKDDKKCEEKFKNYVYNKIITSIIDDQYVSLLEGDYVNFTKVNNNLLD